MRHRGHGALVLVLTWAGTWLGAPGAVLADPPELASWMLNTTGATGYNGLPANLQRIRYSTGNVYLNASGIPAYSIGPWGNDPNIPSNQGYLFRIPRTPAVNTGTKTSTPLGAIGAWTNGVPVYNPLDAHSYNNQNIWHQNAVVVEAGDFDSCLGHPAPGGRYHHHQNARCLYASDPTRHSALLGYAFDGYPIYGPYAYANTDGTGGITRMRSSYRLRNITQRTTLPDGTVLSPSQYGPPVSSTYPLGYYVEDFEYAAGLGDLDVYNGRTTATPEYPAGTYAYFVTIDAAGASAYPYALGPRYYGVVATDNLTSMGHVTISETVSDYTPPASAGRVTTVTLAKAGGTSITLSWGPSCSSGAQDYGIYEGTIGLWYSHTAIDCIDNGGDLTETTVSSPGNRYYLIVPLNSNGEGSYGTTSAGTEIPSGSSTCRVSHVLGSCP